MKNHIQSPLPFQGQKRRFVNELKAALKQFSDATVFVDLFGGSGLLSHIVKQERPDCRVIYNDFDDYHVRIENMSRTNKLLSDIRVLLATTEADKKVSELVKKAVLERIKQDEKGGFVDYITLSSSLLFSMNYATNYAEMSKQTLYNKLRLSEYNADGYLDGIEVVKQDYRDLFRVWYPHPDVVFLVDPPYLSTDVSTYSCYWKLGDYLDVLQVLQGTNYFYFTSNKSSILEFCRWMEINLKADNPFHGAIKKECAQNVTHISRYTDIMLYKHK